MKVRKSTVAHLIKNTFPDYTGRLFTVRVSEKFGLIDLNWNGGSRSQYRACSTITGEATGNADVFNMVAPWNNKAEGQSVPVPVGFCVVEHRVSCGKDKGLVFYINPADATLMGMPEVVAGLLMEQPA